MFEKHAMGGGMPDNRKKCFFVKRNPTASEQRRNTKRCRCIFHHMQSMSQPNRSSPRFENECGKSIYLFVELIIISVFK